MNIKRACCLNCVHASFSAGESQFNVGCSGIMLCPHTSILRARCVLCFGTSLCASGHVGSVEDGHEAEAARGGDRWFV